MGWKKRRKRRENEKGGLGKVMLTGSNLFLCSTLQFNSLKECALFTSSPPTPCRASQAHLTTTPKCSCQGSWCPPYCQWHLTMYFLLLFFLKFFSSFGFWNNISQLSCSWWLSSLSSLAGGHHLLDHFLGLHHASPGIYPWPLAPNCCVPLFVASNLFFFFFGFFELTL